MLKPNGELWGGWSFAVNIYYILKTNVMKKVIGLFAFTAITLCSFAQDSTKMQDTSMSAGKHMMKDCVMMKDGQVMSMKDGQKMKLEQVMTLTNGTTVAPD